MTEEIKPKVAEALANIAAFTPACVVCGDPVPRKRATGRSKDTCSPGCHRVLRAFRKYVNDSSYCPSCRHPCSPEERADFRRWRKDRGEVREKPGRPKESEEAKQLRKVTEELGRLKPYVDELLPPDMIGVLRDVYAAIGDSDAVAQNSLDATANS
jgi:hypothetical protein